MNFEEELRQADEEKRKAYISLVEEIESFKNWQSLK